MTGDARREQILDTAVELFSQHGFRGTTTKQIAQAAGVSEAMVFRHFATKDELYGAIIYNKACSVGGSPFPWDSNAELKDAIKRKDDFEVFFQIGISALEKHQTDITFMRLLIHSALEEHELAERFFNEFVSQAYEFIGGYIAARQQDGAMRRVNPRIVVRAFIGMLMHHSLNNILWDKNRRLLNITNEEAAKTFAELILRGVLR